MEVQAIRVSDVERRAVVEKLGLHYADGRLTLEELRERTVEAWSARTDAELLSELERAIGEQSPRHVQGLVVAANRAEPPATPVDDPIALAIATSDGLPSLELLERGDQDFRHITAAEPSESTV